MRCARTAVAAALLLVPLAASPSVAADDPFPAAAKAEISTLAAAAHLGLYDVASVEILEVRDRDSEIPGPFPGYGLRTVKAVVELVRNGSWSEDLNPDLPSWPECATAVNIYLFCRPAGFRYAADLEVDLVETTTGWKILTRNRRSLSRYPLDRYQRCAAAAPGATDQEIIRGCFVAPPGRSLEPARPVPR